MSSSERAGNADTFERRAKRCDVGQPQAEPADVRLRIEPLRRRVTRGQHRLVTQLPGAQDLA